MLPAFSPLNTAAASAALRKTKLDVGKIAAECSISGVRDSAARMPSVAAPHSGIDFLLIAAPNKKPAGQGLTGLCTHLAEFQSFLWRPAIRLKSAQANFTANFDAVQ